MGKLEVGDVGQLVTGGTVNHDNRQHLSNILNLSLGGREVKPITNFQRKAISAAVDEVMSAADLERLEVYRAILTDFGVDKIDELPADRFHDVMSMLRQWRDEASGVDAKPPATAAEEKPAAPQASAPAVPPQPAPPPRIVVQPAPIDLSSLRRRLTVNNSLMVMVVALLAFAAFPKTFADTAEPTAQNACLFAGKPYTAGSIVDMGPKMRRQCVVKEKGAAWSKA